MGVGDTAQVTLARESPSSGSAGANAPASDLRNTVRVDQSRHEIERLQNEFREWKQRRDAADDKRQYETQLNALETVVQRALAGVEKDIAAIRTDQESGNVYDQCSLLEKRLLWVRRVLWGFYREKFDQRDGSSPTAEVLQAAGDIIWSCYRDAFVQVSPTSALKPVPLAYIEPFYSPTALPRSEVPGILKEKRLGDRFLSDIFTQLPIPLVSLPPRCVAEPWWLVYLGHEVGHHVQHDLGLVQPFADLLSDVVERRIRSGEDAGSAEQWAAWGEEVFADAFSVHFMGAAALPAIVELETHPDRAMMARQDLYPAPIVRLAMLARLEQLLGIARDMALPQVEMSRWRNMTPADDSESELLGEVHSDLAMIEVIADALTTRPLKAGVTFSAMSSWQSGVFLPQGDRDGWRNALLNQAVPPVKRRLAEARIITSAAFGVWEKIALANQPEIRRVASDALRSRFLLAVETNRDKETRAADKRVNADVDIIAADISERLRHADAFEW
jgi:hypothetical protein